MRQAFSIARQLNLMFNFGFEYYYHTKDMRSHSTMSSTTNYMYPKEKDHYSDLCSKLQWKFVSIESKAFTVGEI